MEGRHPVSVSVMEKGPLKQGECIINLLARYMEGEEVKGVSIFSENG